MIGENPCLDIVHDDNKQSIKQSLLTAVDKQPDVEARLQALADQYGIPVDAVRLDKGTVERRSKLDAVDYEKIVKDYPFTGSLLSDPQKAAIAHDDIDNLSSIETALQFGKRGSGALASGLYNLSGGIIGAAENAADILAYLPTGRQGIFPDIARGLKDLRQNQFAWRDKLMPEGDGNVEKGVYSGLQSIGQNLPMMGMGVAANSARLLLQSMAATTLGQTYGEDVDQGISHLASTIHGAADATVEAVTGMFPVHQLFKDLRLGSSLFKTMVSQLIPEQLSEQVATFFQDANAQAVQHPEKTLQDFIDERPDAAIQTAIATLVGTGGNVMIGKSADAFLKKASSDAIRTEDSTVELEKINQLAKASKVLKRNTSVVKSFIDSITEDGAVKNLFIDAKTFSQSAVADQVMAALQEVAAQMPEALASGGEIRIPLSDYVTQIAPIEQADQLIDHLRAEGEAFTLAEAKAYEKAHVDELQQEVERVLTAHSQDAAFQQSVQSVKDQLKQQLDEAGRFESSVHDKYATAMASYFAVQAQQLGMKAEDLYKLYPVNVAAEGFGAEIFKQEALLHSDHATNQKIRSWADGTLGSHEVINIGLPSATLRSFGLSDLPIHLTQRVLKKTTQKHRVKVESLQGLAVAIQSPLAVFASKKGANHFVVLTDLKHEDSNIIVALDLNATRNDIEIHDIRSLHPKESMNIINWVEDGLLLGYEKTKGLAWLDHHSQSHSGRDQVSETLANTRLYDSDQNGKFFQSELRRGTFNPATNTISLLKDADLSTFLHEAGHFFLEMQLDMAAKLTADANAFGDTKASEVMLKDVSALLDWFGVESLSDWQKLSFEEKRAYHEQFARGFEAYIFEGKAPSLALRDLFQRFREWMLSIYKSIGALDVELSDEVRGVFDRMLASEEEIKLAEKSRAMFPLFSSAAEAGWSEEDFAAYQEEDRDATQSAIEWLQRRGLMDMQWFNEAKSAKLKQLQVRHDEARREIKAQVQQEVMSRPVYQAWQFLAGKIAEEDKLKNNREKRKRQEAIDPRYDSLFEAIAKLGGVDLKQAEEEWDFDKGGKRIPMPVFGKPLLRKEGGRSIDGMAEALFQQGYLRADEHGRYDIKDFEEKFDAELRGSKQYSDAYQPEPEDDRAGADIIHPSKLKAARLSLDSLSDMEFDRHGGEGLSKEIIQTLKDRKMTATDGLHPDIAAALIGGFDSGDALVRALAAATPPRELIAKLTQQKMLEEHGDLVTPGAMERAADEAIFNDSRINLVSREANDLAQKTGSLRILKGSAKEFAVNLISRAKVKDLSPAQYVRAEVKAAKAAVQASKKGDINLAAAEKRNQLINLYAAKAAYKAQDDVDSGLRYFKKFNKHIDSIDPDYQDQIHVLLERFDFRKLTNKALTRKASLAKWLSDWRDTGVEPDIPGEIKDGAFRMSYKEMSIEEFRGLIDTIKQIEHIGRLKNKLLTAKGKRDFVDIRDEISESIINHAGGREATNRSAIEWKGRTLRWLKQVGASHIKAANWARIMDGGEDGGAMWEYLIRPANERGEFEVSRRAEATADIAKILEPVFKMGKMGGSGKLFPSIGRSLNREQCMAIALNTGNASNLQRLLGGEQWTYSQVMPVLESLNETEWKAVQDIWDYFESYRPEIASKQRRIYGVEPKWIDPKPFTIKSKNAEGETIMLRIKGGYYPVKYDPLASDRSDDISDINEAERQMKAAKVSATTRRSFTKDRKEEVNDMPLLYSFTGIYSGINEVIHDLAFHEWVIDANRLLKDPKIRKAIRVHYGAEVRRELKKWINDIAGGDSKAAEGVDAIIKPLRQNIAISLLAYNIMSATMQPLGLTQSIVRVGAGWVAGGIKQYIANPWAANRYTQERSEFMRNRFRSQFRELHEIRTQVEGVGFLGSVKSESFYLMTKAQQIVDVPTWIGAYNKALAEGNNEDRAIALADQSVIDSQGSGHAKDLSSIERGSETQKLLTTLYGFMNTALNLGVAQTMTSSSKAKRMADLLMIYTVPVVLGFALREALTPDGDDDDWDLEALSKRLLASQIDYLMGLFVVLREFSEAAKTLAGANDLGRGYAGPIGIKMIEDAAKLATQASQAEFDDAFRKAAINLLGDATGLPSAQANRTINGIEALVEGETENPASIGFGFRKQH